MIFGRGGGGGVVNRVTKRSNLAPDYTFSASGDTQSGYRIAGDIDQPLSNIMGLRLNGVYENGESFRDETGLERYAINPVLGIVPGENTRIDLSYEYLHDRRTTDRGVPANGSLPLRGYRHTFFGDPDLSYAKADVHLAAFAIEQQLGANLSIRNRTLYADYDKFYQNVFPSDYLEATREVRLSAYSNSTKRENLFSQTDLVWNIKSGGIDQTILFGFELGRQKSLNRRYNGFFQPADTSSILTPVDASTVDANVIFRPVNTNAGRTPANYNDSKAAIAAIYVQDQLRLSARIEIIAGLRFDRFSLDVENLNNGQQFSRTDTLFSPRVGLVAKPVPNLSLYASYSRSWLPSSGDQFSSLDITTEALKPEKFDNVEIGAKWEPGKNLLATIAIYQLDRTNTRATDPVTNMAVLTGAQRSRGIELGLQGNIRKNWQISAGYALQDAKITRTTNAAPQGREAPLTPRHQFSLWNRYDVNSRLGFGLGVIARSRTFASISNAVTLPGYARVDAALFYKLTSAIEVQLNVENVLGANYFATANSDNNIAPGAPVTGRLSLNLRF